MLAVTTSLNMGFVPAGMTPRFAAKIHSMPITMSADEFTLAVLGDLHVRGLPPSAGPPAKDSILHPFFILAMPLPVLLHWRRTRAVPIDR